MKKRPAYFLFGLLALAFAVPVGAGAESAPLRLCAPPVPQSVALLRFPGSPALRKAGVDAEFFPWRSPEQLRALVASGKVDAVIATLATAAVLAAKGLPCKVLAVYSAPLWLLAAVPSGDAADRPDASPLVAFKSLDGREVLLPFGPGDMPELILKMLARKGGVNLRMRHTGSAMEVVNLLRLGRGQCGLLPEPQATWGARLAPRSGRIVKWCDLKQLWPELFPHREALPTAALLMVGDRARDLDLCALARDRFAAELAWAKAHPAASGQLAKAAYPALGAVLEAAPGVGREMLRDSELLTGDRAGRAARFFLERLFELDPAATGGRLPDAALWELSDADS